jgi:hypothetical protein
VRARPWPPTELVKPGLKTCCAAERKERTVRRGGSSGTLVATRGEGGTRRQAAAEKSVASGSSPPCRCVVNCSVEASHNATRWRNSSSAAASWFAAAILISQVAMHKSCAGLTRPGAARTMQPFRAVRLDVSAAATEERLRLHNLSPQKGSRRDEKRKGRGYGGHQV